MVWTLYFLLQIGLFITPIISQNRNSPCTTPNQERGTCTPVRSCTVIINALASGSSEAIAFAQQSQCGYDSVPLVCCGTRGPSSPKSVQILSHRLLPSGSVCGFQTTNEKIIGGTSTDIDEFPWLVLLRYADDFGDDVGLRCGGSLINQRYVLTAAHCVVLGRNQGLNLSGIRLGEWRLSTTRDCVGQASIQKCAGAVVDVGVERSIPHSQYNVRTRDNDIALIRMQRNVDFTDFIRPICLPSSTVAFPSAGTNMMVAGWGSTENEATSDVKLKVSVPIVSSADCARRMGRRGTITDNQICAGGVQGKDSCQGDSGGPLMNILEQGPDLQWIQEGVTSWGVGCGVAGYPGVYTRVARYSKWIGDNMANF